MTSSAPSFQADALGRLTKMAEDIGASTDAVEVDPDLH
jgi:hypothetical protein